MPLKKKLKEKGFKIITDFSLAGYDTVGFLKVFGDIIKNRPNENDFKKGFEIIKKSLTKI